MKKTSLLLWALFSVLSSSAQYHKTRVPDLVEYNNIYYDTDIERNMNASGYTCERIKSLT